MTSALLCSEAAVGCIVNKISRILCAARSQHSAPTDNWFGLIEKEAEEDEDEEENDEKRPLIFSITRKGQEA